MDATVHLEKKCASCAGTGQIPDEFSSRRADVRPCVDCEGSGLVLTDQGFELLDFIKRRLKVKTNTSVGT